MVFICVFFVVHQKPWSRNGSRGFTRGRLDGVGLGVRQMLGSSHLVSQYQSSMSPNGGNRDTAGPTDEGVWQNLSRSLFVTGRVHRSLSILFAQNHLRGGFTHF